MKLNIKKMILGILLGFMLLGITSVCAATIIKSNEIKYDNTNSKLKSTNAQNAIDELYAKVKTVKFKVGDYVKMVPIKTSFIIPKNLTGHSSDQTINPSELNLWRVIRINDDGTVEIVSEYTSSIGISFYSLTGYQNLTGTLNYIAKQYENSKYTVASRHMGYNGQTEYITNTSKFVYPDPWTATTSNNANESLGGGDTLHNTDINLVNDAIGSLKSNGVNNQESEYGNYYWIASREYNYMGTSKYRWCGRRVDNTGNNNITQFYIYYLYGFNSNDYINTTASIRPIVTLRSDISNISGNGTSESPYILD